MTSQTLEQSRARVLEIIRAEPGLTSQEIIDRMGIDRNEWATVTRPFYRSHIVDCAGVRGRYRYYIAGTIPQEQIATSLYNPTNKKRKKRMRFNNNYPTQILRPQSEWYQPGAQA